MAGCLHIIRKLWLIPILLIIAIPGFCQTDSIANDSLARLRTEAYLKSLLDRTVSEQKSTDELEINEIIVNEMISKHGNDFFDHFTAGFEWPEVEGNYIIIISERPFRTGITQVRIKVNELEVFESFLQPRNSFLEELAGYTRILTVQYIMNYHQIYLELEGKDRRGTGIY